MKPLKKAWPTKDAMCQVYKKHLWGGLHSDFYSGIGSHQPDIVDSYIKAVTTFLASFENPLSICDLGCGDFNVGSKLVKHTKKYIAVDIVHDLIERNKAKFKADNLEFHCLDIAVDDLPPADCAIVRQVLQHLSNAEVLHIVDRLVEYKYVILTEHLPTGAFTPNKDIISGQGIRLKNQSGLDLLAPPFNFRMKERRILSSVVIENGKGVIETALFSAINRN